MVARFVTRTAESQGSEEMGRCCCDENRVRKWVGDAVMKTRSSG
jgi:hypothetical protein